MTLLARIRRVIHERRELFPGIPSQELRRVYWEQRGLAEEAAFDGYFATSRGHHESAVLHLKALKRRGDTVFPSPTPEARRTSEPATIRDTRLLSGPGPANPESMNPPSNGSDT